MNKIFLSLLGLLAFCSAASAQIVTQTAPLNIIGTYNFEQNYPNASADTVQSDNLDAAARAAQVQFNTLNAGLQISNQNASCVGLMWTKNYRLQDPLLVPSHVCLLGTGALQRATGALTATSSWTGQTSQGSLGTNAMPLVMFAPQSGQSGNLQIVASGGSYTNSGAFLGKNYLPTTNGWTQVNTSGVAAGNCQGYANNDTITVAQPLSLEFTAPVLTVNSVDGNGCPTSVTMTTAGFYDLPPYEQTMQWTAANGYSGAVAANNVGLVCDPVLTTAGNCAFVQASTTGSGTGAEFTATWTPDFAGSGAFFSGGKGSVLNNINVGNISVLSGGNNYDATYGPQFGVSTYGAQINGGVITTNRGYYGVDCGAGVGSTSDVYFNFINPVNATWGLHPFGCSDFHAGFTKIDTPGVAATGSATSSVVTFTDSSATVTLSNAVNPFVPGTVVQLTTSGSLPGNFATSTNYWVSPTGWTTSSVQLTAIPGTVSIKASGTGSGTQTMTIQYGGGAAQVDNITRVKLRGVAFEPASGSTSVAQCIALGQLPGYVNTGLDMDFNLEGCTNSSVASPAISLGSSMDSYVHLVVNCATGGTTCYPNSLAADFCANGWGQSDTLDEQIFGEAVSVNSGYSTGGINCVAPVNTKITNGLTGGQILPPAIKQYTALPTPGWFGSSSSWTAVTGTGKTFTIVDNTPDVVDPWGGNLASKISDACSSGCTASSLTQTVSVSSTSFTSQSMVCASSGNYFNSNHNLIAGTAVKFTAGSLCTGMSTSTVYYVSPSGLSHAHFYFATTPFGALVTCSSSCANASNITMQVAPNVCVSFYVNYLNSSWTSNPFQFNVNGGITLRPRTPSSAPSFGLNEISPGSAFQVIDGGLNFAPNNWEQLWALASTTPGATTITPQFQFNTATGNTTTAYVASPAVDVLPVPAATVPSTSTGVAFPTPNQCPGQFQRPISSRSVYGTSTNDNGQPGTVGYTASASAVSSAVSLTTATPANLTSVALNAGDWMCSAQADYVGSAAATTIFQQGLNTTSATFGGQDTYSLDNRVFASLSATQTQMIPTQRFSLASASTVYLVGQTTFSAGTVTAGGKITCVEIR